MRKNKTWEITLTDNVRLVANEPIENAVVYTTDTEAYLNFRVIDSGFEFDGATIAMLNKDDGSIVERSMTKEGDTAVYEIEKDIISHFGLWQAQVLFKQGEEVFTSTPVTFVIERYMMAEQPPRLEDVVSWKRLYDNAIETIQELTRINDELNTTNQSVQQAEAQRVLAENERSEKYESYAQQFNDVITDLSEEKDYNSLPEISAARGGHETLGGRLDKTDAQLAQTDVTHQQTESVKSLPVGSKDGPVKDFEYKGQTLVNMIKNGDFSDGTTGWLNQNSVISITLNEASFIATASNGRLTQWLNIQNSDQKLYQYAHVKSISNLTRMSIHGSINSVYHSGSGQYEILSSVHTQYTTGASSQFQVLDGRGSGWSEIYVKNALLINLTQIFGAGNEPTKEEMDGMINGYIDGMQSVKADVKTVGKNLLDGELYVYGGNITFAKESDDYIFKSTDGNSGLALTDKFLSSNATYKFSYDMERTTSGVPNFILLDSNNLRITTNTQFTIEKSGIYKVGLEFYKEGLGDIKISNIQLEEGTTATEYEPYKASTLTAEPTLRRLPNGVADRVVEQDGELWLEKRVSDEVILDESIIANLLTSGLTNLDRVGIYLDGRHPNRITNSNPSIIQGSVLLEGFSETTIEDRVEKAFMFYTAGAGLNVWIMVPKGHYATLEEAQADLVGTKLLYQLATPELINLTEQGLTTGELMSYANGTSFNNGSLKGEVNFKVPTSTGAQITSLVESSERQAKQIVTLSEHVAQLISGV